MPGFNPVKDCIYFPPCCPLHRLLHAVGDYFGVKIGYNVISGMCRTVSGSWEVQEWISTHMIKVNVFLLEWQTKFNN